MSEFDRVIDIILIRYWFQRGMKKLREREQQAANKPLHNLDPVVNNKLEQAGRSVHKAWCKWVRQQ